MGNGVEEAAERLRRRDYDGARAIAEVALAREPDNPALLLTLGSACCHAGDLAVGADHLRRSLALDPRNKTARLLLIHALIALGAFEEAAQACAGGGDDNDILRQHAHALQELGRTGEAEDVYTRLSLRLPDDPEVWNNLGNVRLAGGELDGALSALRRAQELAPSHPLIHLNLALLHSAAARTSEALASAAEAARLSPGHPAAHLVLGRLLLKAGTPDDALAALKAAARLEPRDPGIRCELGHARAATGDTAGAEKEHQAALGLQPGFAPAWVALGSLAESGNKTEEMAELLRRASVNGVPEAELAYIRALWLRREGRLNEALACARAAPPSTLPAAKAQLIGEIADRLGLIDEAFSAFLEMNRITAADPSEPRVAAAKYRQQLAEAEALTTSAFCARWKAFDPDGGRPAPVFLLGFPRSGTTLLDTILMGHPRLHVLEELPVLASAAERLGPMERLSELEPEEVRALRADYFEAVERLAPGGAGKTVVDKLPLAIGLTPLIHRIFPEARFIFVKRHPCDAVLSCFMTNFKLNPAMSNFLDLGDAAALYDRVMHLWERCRSTFNLNVHELRYENMVGDLEGEVRLLMQFLELDWDPGLSDHRASAKYRGYVSSPSYAQVTEPIYTRSIARWERYRAHMAPVLPVLSPWAERFGYEI